MNVNNFKNSADHMNDRDSWREMYTKCKNTYCNFCKVYFTEINKVHVYKLRGHNIFSCRTCYIGHIKKLNTKEEEQGE